MCIVIDTNTLAAVLDKDNDQHEEFLPVFKWIIEGKGKIVYGGTSYKKEIFEKMSRFNRLIQELTRLRKTVPLLTEDVDREELRIRGLEPSADFDDPHIVAILDVSKCILLCSVDKRSDKFTKNKKFYANRTTPPKIYRQAKHHKKLLCDTNIADCCRPNVLLNRAQKEETSALL